MISRFIFEEDGQTLVEYGILISLIALAVVAVVTLFGRGVQRNWNASDGQLSKAFNSASG